MSAPLSDAALDQLFRSARTHRAFTDEPVSAVTLQALAELVVLGPTANNMLPARFVFVTSKDAKARLLPLMAEGNRPKVASAPVTAIVGADHAFYKHLPNAAAPDPDRVARYDGKPDLVAELVMRNSSLQGGYLILAARALGLDAGPMSGFDNAAVDAEFFKDTAIRSNFVCNLGHGDPAQLRPRQPRFAFDEFCTVL
ncbi:MAG: malonic semialdehyde reductase [Rhodobiaceae bacterium]|nr:malonic semialdehyde reductase [Rhodobiaceae bacterium]